MLKYSNAFLPSFLSVQPFMKCVELVYKVSLFFFSVNVTIDSHLFYHCYSQIDQGMPWQVVVFLSFCMFVPWPCLREFALLLNNSQPI